MILVGTAQAQTTIYCSSGMCTYSSFDPITHRSLSCHCTFGLEGPMCREARGAVPVTGDPCREDRILAEVKAEVKKEVEKQQEAAARPENQLKGAIS